MSNTRLQEVITLSTLHSKYLWHAAAARPKRPCIDGPHLFNVPLVFRMDAGDTGTNRGLLRYCSCLLFHLIGWSLPIWLIGPQLGIAHLQGACNDLLRVVTELTHIRSSTDLVDTCQVAHTAASQMSYLNTEGCFSPALPRFQEKPTSTDMKESTFYSSKSIAA
ncbi:uncharacterized protein F5147DRAFT_301121 [Suillus discolor]|uniref:Uncharacterized protein n=1 Tax=Suillus discolor TaxID=1912936 RepID=A0A9P7JYX2_9AGAM|nr:uncharacterized protein F5147DRAFT_301121 [Suillus discolor]KAG2117096.1 hypothetical protein F5147DRAFT_301121 [Suillus discolor]